MQKCNNTLSFLAFDRIFSIFQSTPLSIHPTIGSYKVICPPWFRPTASIGNLHSVTASYIYSWHSISIYSTGSKLQLLITSVVEEYKVAKAQQVLMKSDSNDVGIYHADVNIWTGCKWSASSALSEGRGAVTSCCIIGNQDRLVLEDSKLKGVSWHRVERGLDGGIGKVCQICSHEATRHDESRAWWEKVQERSLYWQDVWSMG